MRSLLLVFAFLFAAYASAQEPAKRDAAAQDSIVYITREGKKYHRENCSYLSKSKLRVTLREAIENRYEPCKRCYKQADTDTTAN